MHSRLLCVALLQVCTISLSDTGRSTVFKCRQLFATPISHPSAATPSGRANAGKVYLAT
jgi:hypothetical protein